MRSMAGRLAAPLVVACLWVAGAVVSAGAQASGPPHLCLRLQRGAACGAGGVMAWGRGRRRGGAGARGR